MSHFRTPHESYLGKKLEHCPNCAAEVYWAKDKDGYEYWICTKCGEQYLFKLPLDEQDKTNIMKMAPRKKWWLRTPTTNTNEIQLKPSTSPTPVTPTMTLESSDEDKLTYEQWEAASRKQHAQLNEAYQSIKDQPTSPLSKSRSCKASPMPPT